LLLTSLIRHVSFSCTLSPSSLSMSFPSLSLSSFQVVTRDVSLLWYSNSNSHITISYEQLHYYVPPSTYYQNQSVLAHCPVHSFSWLIPVSRTQDEVVHDWKVSQHQRTRLYAPVLQGVHRTAERGHWYFHPSIELVCQLLVLQTSTYYHR
jgi:hypothetical protein